MHCCNSASPQTSYWSSNSDRYLMKTDTFHHHPSYQLVQRQINYWYAPTRPKRKREKWPHCVSKRIHCHSLQRFQTWIWTHPSHSMENHSQMPPYQKYCTSNIPRSYPLICTNSKPYTFPPSHARGCYPELWLNQLVQFHVTNCWSMKHELAYKEKNNSDQSNKGKENETSFLRFKGRPCSLLETPKVSSH